MRRNPLGIQMLPKSIHKQLFLKEPNPSQDLIELSKKHLEHHNLLNKNSSDLPSIDIPLPQLSGSLSLHFYKLGLEQSQFFIDAAKRIPTIPPLPKIWKKTPGWTRYSTKGSTSIDYPPDGETLIFDTEVMYKLSPFAVIATAVSENAWYSWCAPNLDVPSSSLIPMGPSRRLVVGHHVSFDRARIQEEYNIQKSQIHFLDTLSLHSSVGGLSTQQRTQFLHHQKLVEGQIDFSDDEQGIKSIVAKRFTEKRELDDSWKSKGTTNSLKAAAKFYLKKEIDKSDRDYFGSESMDVFKDDDMFQSLMTYCAKDVQITNELFKVLFPKFQEKCSHPVSLAGILHMSKGFLPITKRWNDYIERSEQLCQDHQKEIEECLCRITESVLQVQDPQEDTWLKYLDWDIKPIKMTKEKSIKGQVIPSRPYANVNPQLIGKPKWYRDLWDSKLKRIRLSLSKKAVPYLLKLEWNGYPLVFHEDFGWLYQTPLDVEIKNTKPLEIEGMDPDRNYYRIPHPAGEGKNCGNPLAKAFIKAFEAGVLRSSIPEAKHLLDLHAKCTYWISARERIMSQMVVWDSSVIGKEVGVIVPNTITMGTVTRRATEPTWMTASNAKKNLIGSELKAMVSAPPGFAIVGADVDAQELWIASLLGDAQFQIHGGSAIGFMTLQGSKSLGTDLHSVTGKLIGMSRDIAKIFNYSRIYGAGAKYAADLITKHSPDISAEEAREKANSLFLYTKGKKHNNKEKQFWQGGSESFMFNQLESIAKSADSRTPVLNCQIPDTLNSKSTKNEFMTSRINWAVQSSGVDYLHLLLVSMDYLMQLLKVNGRFLLSIHDEIRFLVPEESKYLAALALQISNLWTRAYFASRVGIHDLPLNVAFFSAVDIDKVLRKEVFMDCVTPSNSEPIPPGESLDIYQLMDKLKGMNIKQFFGTEPTKDIKLEGFDEAYWEAPSQILPASDIEWIKAQMHAPKTKTDKSKSATTTTNQEKSKRPQKPLINKDRPRTLKKKPYDQQFTCDEVIIND